MSTQYPDSYTCPTCLRTLSSKYCLQSHQKTHTPKGQRLRPFSCPVEGCYETFLHEQTQKRHVDRHSNAPGQYTCTICSQRFTTVFGRNRHITNRRCRTSVVHNPSGVGVEATPILQIEDAKVNIPSSRELPHPLNVEICNSASAESGRSTTPLLDGQYVEAISVYSRIIDPLWNNLMSQTIKMGFKSWINHDLWHAVMAYLQTSEELYINIAKHLLKAGADPDFVIFTPSCPPYRLNKGLCDLSPLPKRYRRSMLNTAISKKSTAMVKLLLTWKASIHLRYYTEQWLSSYEETWNAVQFACYGDVPDNITRLILARATEKEDIDRALIVAAHTSSPSKVLILLSEFRADPQYSISSGTTALHVACMSGSKQNIFLLLEAGAQANNVDSCGLLPIAYLFFVTHTIYTTTRSAKDIQDIFDRHISYGADINKKSVLGHTLLHICIIAICDFQPRTRMLLDSISLLIKRGADPYIRDIHGDTPLELLNKNSSYEDSAFGPDSVRSDGYEEAAFILESAQRLWDEAREPS